ncbi:MULTISPECIES: PDR/VanB family oxidoreductase [Rhodococcus]|uniref:PDR/VanB family oxidoreductase n=1 Tax=Rhodococcus TaxID=1827 RepID=UPI001E321ED8|nr:MULTISPECIES: PDR/VanB family oxidoreductase [Rhodococcus]MCD2104570.1 PDR/VanB family oxidoreductase [Rhodococcus qingshengii]MCZ4525305.1 PDR/VanB family oxidoreductase [Rhodococcus erythropolis]MDV8009129.1 PDR/VanB family oxidoreductase [Rhodococcus sp. IEGM 1318]
MLEAGMFTVVVVGRSDVAADVIALELALPDDGDLPGWNAGAHVDIGVGGDDVRQYSLCGSTTERTRWRIGVLREPNGRGGSAYLHDRAQIGCTLQVSLPRNNFPLVDASAYVFVAGGIGITPILPMIAAAECAGAQWQLYYGGRTRASMAFVDELAAHGDKVAILPQDEAGLLPLADIARTAGAETCVYCCGPEPLLAAAEQHGKGALHVERFAPRPIVVEEPDSAFDVRIVSTGDVIRVGPDQALVDALERAGVSVVTSCREGTCSSCETKVLSGSPIHRDSVLSDDERERSESMMVCVSRAAVSPVLELDL